MNYSPVYNKWSFKYTKFLQSVTYSLAGICFQILSTTLIIDVASALLIVGITSVVKTLQFWLIKLFIASPEIQNQLSGPYSLASLLWWVKKTN